MERGAAGEVLALLRRFEGRVDLESRSAIAMLRVAAPSARSAPGDSTARIVAVIDHLGAVHGACAAHERELVKAIKVLRSHGDASVVTIAKALLQRWKDQHRASEAVGAAAEGYSHVALHDSVILGAASAPIPLSVLRDALLRSLSRFVDEPAAFAPLLRLTERVARAANDV